MKKIMFTISFLVLFASVVYADVAIKRPAIAAKTILTEPYPLEPGKKFILTIEMWNNGTDRANNVAIEIEPTFPFKLLEPSKKNIASISYNSMKLVDYNMFVDGSAVSARYNIPVHVMFDGGDLKVEVVVRVQGIPKFNLLDVSADEVLPGEQAKLYVKVQNIGSGIARKTSSSFSSSSDYVEPVLSGGNIYVGDVNPGKTKDIEFMIYVDNDAEFGVYNGQVKLTYENESGVTQNDYFSIGVPVSGKPELHIIKSETDLVEKKLSVELVNIGSAKAIGITGEIVVEGSVYDVDYMTSIKKDKHTTLKFNLPINKVTTGDLRLSYKGPDNEAYSQTAAVTWTLPKASFTWLYTIVGIVVMIIVWKKKLWKKDNLSQILKRVKPKYK